MSDTKETHEAMSSNNNNNQAANINIDINGADQAEDNRSAVKNMNLDSSQEGRAGLSREELMKYADQPFWVGLRNILFASFWIVWFSILVAAIAYVVNSPNCVKLVSASALPGAGNGTASVPAATAS